MCTYGQERKVDACGRNWDVRRSRKRNDVCAEGANPGDRKLCGGDVLLLGKLDQCVHDSKVVLEVLGVTGIRSVDVDV